MSPVTCRPTLQCRRSAAAGSSAGVPLHDDGRAQTPQNTFFLGRKGSAVRAVLIRIGRALGQLAVLGFSRPRLLRSKHAGPLSLKVAAPSEQTPMG